MSKHLKTHIISRLDAAISYFVPPSDVSALHSRGVRYFVPEEGIDAFWGAMNTAKEGRRYRKHIIVRRAPEHKGLLQALHGLPALRFGLPEQCAPSFSGPQAFHAARDVI